MNHPLKYKEILMKYFLLNRIEAKIFMFFLLTLLVILTGCDYSPGGRIDLESTLYGEKRSRNCVRGVPKIGDEIACVNSPECENDDDCLTNYICNPAKHVCEPILECGSETDCGGGVCAPGQGGVRICQAVEPCVEGGCLPGYHCSQEKRCTKNICGVECKDRGLCTANGCSNKSQCTVGTEATDCLDGYLCATAGSEKGTCVSIDKRKRENPCVRGVCDDVCVRVGECQNVNPCHKGKDECIGGYICNDLGVCEAKVCEQPSDCHEGAEAVGGTCVDGKCKEVPCENNNECFINNVCVKADVSKKGTCMRADEPNKCGSSCGDVNRCIYNANTFVATCEALDFCFRTRDCNGGKICNDSNKCVPDSTCDTPSTSEASSRIEITPTTPAKEYSLCTGEIDYFTFDANRFVGQNSQLHLIVEINRKDVGGGPLNIELVDSSGAHQRGSNFVDGKYLDEIRITDSTVFEGLGKSEYQLNISNPAGGRARIRYKIRLQSLSQTAAVACANSVELESGKVRNGILKPLDSNLGGEATVCDRGEVRGNYFNAYSFTVSGQKPKFVTLKVMPSRNASNPSLIIKEDCASLDSVILSQGRYLCVNEKPEGKGEEVSLELEPGKYTALVTSGGDGRMAMDYRILYEEKDIVCDFYADSVCNRDTNKVVQCLHNGTDTVEIDCGANGCNKAGTRCEDDKGLLCDYGTEVSLGNDFVGDLDLANYNNYSSPSVDTGCGDLTQAFTGGPEAYFDVKLDSDEAMYVTVTKPKKEFELRSSVYLLNKCGSLRCDESASVEEISNDEIYGFYFKNTTGETVYKKVVVDSETPHDSYDPAKPHVEIHVRNAVSECVPKSKKCEENKRAVFYCDLNGAWQTIEYCAPNVSCTEDSGDAKCNAPVGMRCNKAINVTNMRLPDQLFIYYKDTYDTPMLCDEWIGADNTYFEPNSMAKDIVYSVKASGGSTLRFSVISKGKLDLHFWMIDPSQTTNASSFEALCSGRELLCSKGIEWSRAVGFDEEEGNFEEVYETVVEGDPTEEKTFYFVVESSLEVSKTPMFEMFEVSSSVPKTPFEGIRLNTKEVSSRCMPNDKLIENYSSLGAKRYYHCPFGCENAASGENGRGAYCKEDNGTLPDAGRACATALPIDTESVDHGEFPVIFSGRDQNNIEFTTGSKGNCTILKPTLGPDKFYMFDLKANETLTIDVEVGERGNLSEIVSAYLMSDCFDYSTCDGFRQTGSNTLSYRAGNEAEQVFLVIDSNYMSVDTFDDVKVIWRIAGKTKYECAPNTTKCTFDKKGVEVCDSRGNSKIYTCPTGSECESESGACLLKMENNIIGDKCDAKSPELEDKRADSKYGFGGYFKVFPSDFGNDVETLCLGNPENTAGSDAFVKFHAKNGEVVTVEAHGGGQVAPSVYLLKENCSSPDVCLASAVGSPFYKKGTRFAYEIQEEGDFIVAFDTSSLKISPADSIPVYYFVDIARSECADGEVKCDDNGGVPPGHVSQCLDGRWVEIASCAAGCALTQCVSYQTPLKGDVPIHPFLYSDPEYGMGKSITISMANATDTSEHLLNEPYGSGLFGGCIFAKRPSGPDQYLKVHLQANAVLDVTLSGNENGEAVLYLLSDDMKTCVASDSNYGNLPVGGKRHLVFKNGAEGSYYIVVDSMRKTKGEYKLNYNITNGRCEPFTSICLDNKTLQTCTYAATQSKVECPYDSQCIGSACVASVKQDSVSGVKDEPIGEGAFVGLIDFENMPYTSQLSLRNGQTQTCYSADEETIFNDVYYKLKVPARGRVTYRSQKSNPDLGFAVFVLKGNDHDVADTPEDKDVCRGAYIRGNIDGTSNDWNDLETIYRNTTNSEVEIYLVVDAYRIAETLNNSAKIYVEVQGPDDCSTNTCEDGRMKTCVDGLYEYYDCRDLRCDASGSGCERPRGDRCEDMLDPLESGTKKKFTGTINMVGSDINRISRCDNNTGLTYDMSGSEVFVKVKMKDKESVALKVTNTTGCDYAIYMMKDICSYARNMCDENPELVSDRGDEEFIEYTYDKAKNADKDAGYKIFVIDHFGSADEPNCNVFNLDIKMK